MASILIVRDNFNKDIKTYFTNNQLDKPFSDKIFDFIEKYSENINLFIILEYLRYTIPHFNEYYPKYDKPDFNEEDHVKQWLRDNNFDIEDSDNKDYIFKFKLPNSKYEYYYKIIEDDGAVNKNGNKIKRIGLIHIVENRQFYKTTIPSSDYLFLERNYRKKKFSQFENPKNIENIIFSKHIKCWKYLEYEPCLTKHYDLNLNLNKICSKDKKNTFPCVFGNIGIQNIEKLVDFQQFESDNIISYPIRCGICNSEAPLDEQLFKAIRFCINDEDKFLVKISTKKNVNDVNDVNDLVDEYEKKNNLKIYLSEAFEGKNYDIPRKGFTIVDSDKEKKFIFIHIIYLESNKKVIEPIIFTYLNLDNKDTFIPPKSRFTYEEAIKITSPKVDKNIKEFENNIKKLKEKVWNPIFDKEMIDNLDKFYWKDKEYWKEKYLNKKNYKLYKYIKPYRSLLQFILNKKIDFYFGLGFRKNIIDFYSETDFRKTILSPVITKKVKSNLFKKYFKNIYEIINPRGNKDICFINKNTDINPILDNNTIQDNEPLEIKYNLLDIGKNLPIIQIDNKDYLLGTPYLQEDKYYRNIYEEDGTLYGNIRYNELSIKDKDIEKDININICTSK